MNSKRIGNIGEAYALAKLVELGIPVYQQFGDNEPADYLIIVNNIIYKIQVKTSTTNDGNSVIFDLVSSTSHRKLGVKHKYSKEEVDYFICYDTVTNILFLIKNNGNMTSIRIRYENCRQQKNINKAEDLTLCVETLHRMSKD